MNPEETYKNSDWLREKYWDEELSREGIAELAKVTPPTIRKWMQKFNLGVRSRREASFLRDRREKKLDPRQTYRNEEWLRGKYEREQKNQAEIAELAGVSPPTIRSYLDKFGISTMNDTGLKKYQSRGWLKHQYHGLKKDTYEIASLCNVNHATISNWLRRLKIPVRSRSEAIWLGRMQPIKISKVLLEILNGCLLGDGWLEKDYTTRFAIEQSYAHRDWVYWLSDLFKAQGIEVGKASLREKISFGKKIVLCSLKTHSYKEFNFLREKWYPDGVKIVPRDINLTPRTVLHWHLGDGCFTHPEKVSSAQGRVYFSTQGFSEEDRDILQDKLSGIGIATYLAKQGQNGTVVYIKESQVLDLFQYLGSCPKPVSSLFGYKWPDNFNSRKGR